MFREFEALKIVMLLGYVAAAQGGKVRGYMLLVSCEESGQLRCTAPESA